MKPYDPKYYDGKGCKCGAWGKSECACGISWVDSASYHKIHKLETKLKTSETENECMSKSLVSVTAQLSEAKQGGEWRGIESAPRDGIWFLSYSSIGDEYTVMKYGKRYYEDDHGYGMDMNYFTHWQPLPISPEGGKK